MVVSGSLACGCGGLALASGVVWGCMVWDVESYLGGTPKLAIVERDKVVGWGEQPVARGCSSG